jgi:hypothetical protein
MGLSLSIGDKPLYVENNIVVNRVIEVRGWTTHKYYRTGDAHEYHKICPTK